ncbi:TPA: NACHT domain-containing protein, partial [Pseudomonas aeruginosa]|nr:NACHT domain-containing protein [Pseudomonas aeruginosa]
KNWKTEQTPESNWLVILGEYGTGKTALTQNLQYEWTNEYKLDPSQPIPIRIELRNFSRQFDSRSLIHHFLDTNRLGHVPIEHFFYLLRNKRIVLIL